MSFIFIFYIGGESMEIKGIDISEWQGNLSLDDFKKIKEAGIEFVIIRCGYTTYGKSKLKYVDDYFENNYKLCKQVGLPVGTYYYSCATTIEESTSEAEFVLKLIKNKQFEYPIVIDTEDNHDIKNSNYANTSQASIGKTKLTPIISNFCNILEKNNHYVSIYASTYWFRNRLILDDLVAYDKWIAQWSESVNFEEKYGIWQYSSTGRVNGISGNVDLDYSYKDYPKIMKDMGLNGFVKEVPEIKEYTLTINYLYEDGSMASPSLVKQIVEGTNYSYTSPGIIGYTPDRTVISGIMDKDETYDVIYTKEEPIKQPSFWKKIITFFKGIFSFLKNLFK